MDSGCSRHMTGDDKWFSSLTPMSIKENITFGDKSQGKVMAHGCIKVTDKYTLKDVALVKNLHYNLLSVSQFLEDDFEVRFKKEIHVFLILLVTLFARFLLLDESLKLIFPDLLVKLAV